MSRLISPPIQGVARWASLPNRVSETRARSPISDYPDLAVVRLEFFRIHVLHKLIVLHKRALSGEGNCDQCVCIVIRGRGFGSSRPASFLLCPSVR